MLEEQEITHSRTIHIHVFFFHRVAHQMVHEAMKVDPKFSVYFGLEGWMLSTLTSGMAPESSLFDSVCQVALMGLFRFVSFFYLNDFWSKVQKCNADEL